MHSKIKKKRIIFFLPNFSLGGASESILKLAKYLVKKNFSILVISLGKNFYKKDFQKINCDLIEINSSRVFFSIFKIRKIMITEINKKFEKIVFISNMHYANIISTISAVNLKKIKIILTERSSIAELNYSNNLFHMIKNRIIHLFAKFLYKFADLIITNSQFEKKLLKKSFNLDRIICIHPPSIEKVFKSVKNKSKSKKVINIIYVGRLSKEKGIFTILKALCLIKESYNFIFNIYGNGPYKYKITKFIKANNLDKIIKLNGYKSNKDLIFKKADLFINASFFEGLPNALVQSINYNVYPICSDAPGGNIEVIKNGVLGSLFKMDDEKDLQKKIVIFLRKKIKLNNNLRIEHLKNYTEMKSNKKYLASLEAI